MRLILAHGSPWHRHWLMGSGIDYGKSCWIARLVGPNSSDPDHGMEFWRGIGVSVPTVVAMPLLIGFPIWIWTAALRRRIVMRRRTRNGLCAACGYDLRASPEQCPECGRVPRRAEPV